MGNDGHYGRADLTELNMADYPSILIEMGNMKHHGRGQADDLPHRLMCISAARSRGAIPPQIPYGSCASSAYSRHRESTGQLAQMRLALFS
jgi:hypothetical protein